MTETKGKRMTAEEAIGRLDHGPLPEPFLREALPALIRALEAEIKSLRDAREALQKQVFVPGVRKCAKCKFAQVSTTLHAQTGGMSANNEPCDCPNGCGPLWPLTERDAGNEMVDRWEAEHARAEKAEAALATLTHQLSEARGKALEEAALAIEDEKNEPQWGQDNNTKTAQVSYAECAAIVRALIPQRVADLIRRRAQANKTLPDWNTLSNEARDAMKEAAGFHVSDAWAAQCALDVYNAGRRALSTRREYDRSRRP